MIDTTAIFYSILTVQNFPGFLFSSILQMSPSARIFCESTKIHLKTMFECELMFLPPYIVGIQEGLGLTPHCLKQPSEYSFMFHEWGSNMSSTPSEQVGMTISVQAWKSKPGKILVRKWNTKSEINCPRSYSSEAKKWGFELNSLASEPLFFTPYHLSLFLRLNWEVTEVRAIYSFFTNYFISYLLSYWILKKLWRKILLLLLLLFSLYRWKNVSTDRIKLDSLFSSFLCP